MARELTKVYEEVQRGSLAELAQAFSQREIKGEICLVVAGRPPEEKELLVPATSLPQPDPASLVSKLQAKGYGRKQSMREAARRLGISRREVYQKVVAEKQKQDPNTT